MMAATPLSEALRGGTRALHTQAERTGVMAALLRGQLDLAGYARLLAALREVYAALETELEAHNDDPVLALLRHPGLARRAAIESDLAVLVRLGVAPASVAPEALAYAEHLHELARRQPTLLAAHAWLRYLGDLNGGRVLERIVREKLGVPADAMSFYRFPALADPMSAAVSWRLALDSAPVTVELQQALVSEACAGFERHIALFRALAPSGQDAAGESSAA
jgi:heme oxygenase